MSARISKNITNVNDINELLEIREEDITTSLLIELFGEFDEEQKFHPYDTFTVPKGIYGKNKKNSNSFTTTVGIWIFNRYCIENELSDLLGYINKEIDSKQWGKIIDTITRATLEDDVDIKVLDRLLQKSQKLMPMCTILTPSITDKFLNVSKYIEPKKKELFKKYEKELAEGDIVISEKIEKELIAYAMDYLKDDPSLDLYLSGARSNIGNHFKNMYIMKGAIRNPDPNAEHQYTVAQSCYNNGISKEEYPLFANSLAAGPYSRAKKTEVGGYYEKLLTNGFQALTLDKQGSDCGTSDIIEIHLTDKNIDDWMYSYIKSGSQYIELNSKNKDTYIDRTVQFRFAALCESKTGICNKCAGNLFYKLNITNIGLAMMLPASRLKNINMKAFHDSSVSSSTINPKIAFGE